MIIQTGLAQNCASKLAKYSQTKMEKNNRVIRNLLILVVFFATVWCGSGIVDAIRPNVMVQHFRDASIFLGVLSFLWIISRLMRI
jgi:hypothetical protein